MKKSHQEIKKEGLLCSQQRKLLEGSPFVSLPVWKAELRGQDNQGTQGRTWVLTPKSHNLTWPLVFTNILEGFTSVLEEATTKAG